MNDVKRCPDPYFNMKAQLTNGAGSAMWVFYNPSLETLEIASLYVPDAQLLISQFDIESQSFVARDSETLCSLNQDLLTACEAFVKVEIPPL